MHIIKWKKPIWKICILYDSNYMTFWKRQNRNYSRRASGCQELQERETCTGGALRIFRAGKISYMIQQPWIYVIIHLSKSIEYATPRVSRNVSYGLLVIIMCRFISCNKGTTPGWDEDSGGGWVQGVRGHINSVLPACRFYCEPKTAL